MLLEMGIVIKEIFLMLFQMGVMITVVIGFIGFIIFLFKCTR